jgi:hypothetical protein
VHRGITVCEGYEDARLEWVDPDEHIRHYWMDTYQQLFSKHWRYIRREGASLCNNGERFTWKRLAIEPMRAFKESLIDKQGWKDGGIGLFLSLFWSWYTAMRLISLHRHETTQSG